MSMMKIRAILSLTALFILGHNALAQDVTTSADTAAVHRQVFQELPQNVTVNQSAEVQDQFFQQITKHPSENTHSSYVGGESVRGTFQIRIFSDSGQNARYASQDALNRFRTMYPDEPAALTFTAPYFKVTVGHYRSYNEAMSALQNLKGAFPKAHIVR